MKKDHYAEIEKLILISPKPIYVAFALYCARDQLHNIKDESLYKQCNDALAVTEAYMKGQASQAEVEAAYNAVSAAHNAAYNATYSAAYNATYSAAHSDKLKEYYEKLKEMLKNLSEIERIVYNICD